MTNTLHRYGDSESFYDDYIVFASPSNGNNDVGSIPKLKAFLEMALAFGPVNIGDPAHGGALRPSTDLTTIANWHRDLKPDFRKVIDGIDEPATVGDLAAAPPTYLLPGDDLRTALNRFSEAMQETLPVIDNAEGRRVIGYLSEAYALRRYAHELERHRGAQPDDAGIFSPTEGE